MNLGASFDFIHNIYTFLFLRRHIIGTLSPASSAPEKLPVLAALRLAGERENENQGNLRSPARCDCDLGTPLRSTSGGAEEAERFKREYFLFHSPSRKVAPDTTLRERFP